MNIVKPELKPVKGGEFFMGENTDKKHKIILNDFFMLNIPITQAVYSKIMNANPAKFQDVTKPVENVTWYDAIMFCNALSVAMKRTPCYSIDGKTKFDNQFMNDTKWAKLRCDFYCDGFRLPTEAEWEYAATGGQNHTYTKYSGSDNVDAVAWYGENSQVTTHAVANKDANVLGIYDMSGNVEEWCWDNYGEYDYSKGENPRGPSEGKQKVKRGGSWLDDSIQCEVTYRGNSAPFAKSSNLGFRICVSAVTKDKE